MNEQQMLPRQTRSTVSEMQYGLEADSGCFKRLGLYFTFLCHSTPIFICFLIFWRKFLPLTLSLWDSPGGRGEHVT